MPLNQFLLFFLIGLTLFPSTSFLQAKSESVDYVVVGVGTAGAVVAKLLSDDKKTTVIALHSGENLNSDPLIKFSQGARIIVPAALLGNISPLLTPPLYETGLTVPQTFADDRSLLWTIGLPEGGGSAINAGAYCRGTNQVYSQWEAIAGPLWSVARILDIYKKLEHYQGETPNPIFRGYSGALSVRQNKDPSVTGIKFSQAIVDATGFPLVLDYNDPTTPIGVSPLVQYTQTGPGGLLRVSSATAFLNDDVISKKGYGLHGRKLLVHLNSMALRTIWEGNKAVGVEYIKNGKLKRVYAKKGVVVCSGLRSSAFLLHSGIGPQEALHALNIPVIFNNPNVGQDLTDQPHIIIAFATNPDDFSKANLNSIFDQISWLPAPGGDPLVRQVRISTITTIPGLTISFVDLVQALSRGSITISSANPIDPPVINPGELTDSSDLTLFRTVFQTYIKDINIALQAIDPKYQLVFPNPAILDDPVALDAFIREEVDVTQHFQSHCRMAPLDQGGVVDSSGHVYGVRNLIVADNSIVPQGMDGSPMASAYLIGANIAQILIELDKNQ